MVRILLFCIQKLQADNDWIGKHHGMRVPESCNGLRGDPYLKVTDVVKLGFDLYQMICRETNQGHRFLHKDIKFDVLDFRQQQRQRQIESFVVTASVEPMLRVFSAPLVRSNGTACLGEQ